MNCLYDVGGIVHVTWSIAVEEQFYLIWAPLVKRLKKKFLPTIISISLFFLIVNILNTLNVEPVPGSRLVTPPFERIPHEYKINWFGFFHASRDPDEPHGPGRGKTFWARRVRSSPSPRFTFPPFTGLGSADDSWRRFGLRGRSKLGPTPRGHGTGSPVLSRSTESTPNASSGLPLGPNC